MRTEKAINRIRSKVGHSPLTEGEMALLKKFRIDLYPGAPKALFVSGTGWPEPTAHEMQEIKNILSKDGKILHHLHIKTYEPDRKP